jgi:hypothetical protein
MNFSLELFVPSSLLHKSDEWPVNRDERRAMNDHQWSGTGCGWLLLCMKHPPPIPGKLDQLRHLGAVGCAAALALAAVLGFAAVVA